MKKSKLILKLQGFVALWLVALALTACSGNPTPTTASATTAPATTAAGTTVASTTAVSTSSAVAATTANSAQPAATVASSGLKAEITIADGVRQNETTLLKAQVDAFKKAYPNIKVTTVHYNAEELSELVKAAAGSSSAPDLIIAPSDYTADWVNAKALQPADKVLDSALISGYAPNALGASQLNGSQWGVPFTYGNVPVLLYNKKLVPTPPATTDDMIKLAQSLTSKNDNRRDSDYGLALDVNQPVWFVAFLGGFGGTLLDANQQPTLNTPEMVKALQFYQDLVIKDKVANPQYEAGMNQLEYAFRDGRLGMMVAGDWDISSYGGAKLKKKAAAPASTPTAATTGAASLEVTPGTNDYADKFELAVAPLPKVSATGKAAVPLINNKALFFGAQISGDKLNAAKAFVQFLAKPEQQQAMAEEGFVPTTQTAINSEAVKSNPILSGLVEQLAVAKPQPAVMQLRVVWDAIRPNLEAVVADTVKPQQAAQKMQDMALQKVKLLAQSN